MKLKELKSCIDQTVKKAGRLNPSVEVWLGNKCYDIEKIGQFGVVPDVTIIIRKLNKSLEEL